MELKGYKVIVTKAVSQDEQLQMEVHADTPAGLRDRLAAGFAILDARLIEQGQRVIEATTFVRKFPPEVQMAVNAVIGTLYGRPGAIQEVQAAAAAVEQMVKEPSVAAEAADAVTA